MHHDRSSKTLSQPSLNVPCPNCLSYKLEFTLPWDSRRGERAWMARCEGCGYPVLLNGPVETKLRRALQQKEVGSCPRCGSDETRLGLVCNVVSRHSLAVGLCDKCRREFAPGAAA